MNDCHAISRQYLIARAYIRPDEINVIEPGFTPGTYDVQTTDGALYQRVWLHLDVAALAPVIFAEWAR